MAVASLLSLPPEVRVKIYEFAFDNRYFILNHNRRKGFDESKIRDLDTYGLVRCCKQIYAEASPMLAKCKVTLVPLDSYLTFGWVSCPTHRPSLDREITSLQSSSIVEHIPQSMSQNVTSIEVCARAFVPSTYLKSFVNLKCLHVRPMDTGSPPLEWISRVQIECSSIDDMATLKEGEFDATIVRLQMESIRDPEWDWYWMLFFEEEDPEDDFNEAEIPIERTYRVLFTTRGYPSGPAIKKSWYEDNPVWVREVTFDVDSLEVVRTRNIKVD